ncbi:hypothetical protein Thermus77927_09790 [Thermus hydrothermalis]
MKVQAQAFRSALKHLPTPRLLDYVNFDGVKVWTGALDLEVEVHVGDTPFPPIALPRKPLLDLLEGMEEEEVEFTRGEEDKLFLRVGRFWGELHGAPPIKLHILKSLTREVLRSGEDLLEALLKALSLGKTLLLVGEEKVRVVATDGYRIHIYTLPAQGHVEKNYLIPNQVKEALKTLEGPVVLHEAGSMNALVLEAQNGRVGFPLTKDQFPPYASVLPTQPPVNTLIAERKALQNALKRALVVAHPEDHRVHLKVEDGELKVQALDHTQAPISEEVVPGEGQGEVMVNGKFLLQALEECKEERVHLHLHPGPKSPLLEIKEAGFYALMAGLKTATPQNPS